MVAGADDRTLMPLPPGADKNLVAAPGAATRKRGAPSHQQKTIKEEFPADASATPRRRKAAKSDPVFLNQDAPIPLDLPLDTYDGDITLGTRRSRNWTIAVLLVLLLAAGGAAAAFMTLRGKDETRPTAEQTPLGAGAGALMATRDAGTDRDATRLASGSFDDGGGGDDSTDVGRNPEHGSHRPGARVPQDPGNRRTLKVQVITRPERATLYVGTTYAGTGDTFLSRPEGTRLTVTCRMKGYRPGSVEVVFDGVSDVFLCKCNRRKRCIPGIKNPFDDCPE
jgi:hypothetical protein